MTSLSDFPLGVRCEKAPCLASLLSEKEACAGARPLSPRRSSAGGVEAGRLRGRHRGLLRVQEVEFNMRYFEAFPNCFVINSHARAALDYLNAFYQASRFLKSLKARVLIALAQACSASRTAQMFDGPRFYIA